MGIILKDGKNEVRQYLLGELEEEAAEQLELRLLTDPAFAEEFDTVVDEVTDEYIGNEVEGAERKRIEDYFFRSAERQNKARFASALLEAAEERTVEATEPVVVTPKAGIIERATSFWRERAFALRLATTLAIIMIIVGVVFLNRPHTFTSGNYASINLTISAADRATGTESKTVKLSSLNAGIRIELTLPDQIPQSSNYRVELLDEQQASRNLPVVERRPQSLVVAIPANEITRGSYIIHLYDGSGQRIRGSYFFNVE